MFNDTRKHHKRGLNRQNSRVSVKQWEIRNEEREALWNSFERPSFSLFFQCSVFCLVIWLLCYLQDVVELKQLFVSAFFVFVAREKKEEKEHYNCSMRTSFLLLCVQNVTTDNVLTEHF